MTSENQPVEPPVQQSPAAAITSKGSAGFLMIGAIIIVGGHVLFSVLMNRYSFGILYVTIALMTLLSILGIGGLDVVTSRVNKLIGTFIGLAAVLILIDDIRSGFPEGIGLVAALVFYVGAGLMFVGARGLKD